MLKKTITFTDFDGNPRTEDCYFNLTKTELVDWSADSERGIQADMEDAIRTKDMRKLLDFVKELVFRSYGIRDKDGIHFDKSPEISRRFENSAMYDPLLMELFGDEGGNTSAFINGLMPKDLVEAAMKEGRIPNPDSAPPVGASAREMFDQRQQERLQSAFREPVQENPQARHEFQAPIVPTTPAVTVAPDPAQAADPVEARPFRIKETPLEDPGSTPAPQQDDYEQFLAWKAQQDAQPEGLLPRPPHEG